MQTITIEKQRLITKLGENLKGHEEAFKEATTAFYEQLNATLAEVSHKVAKEEMNHKEVMKALREPAPPEAHSDDYVREMTMLEYEEGDTIKLAPEEFTKFVMDEWYWRDEFANSYRMSTGKFLS